MRRSFILVTCFSLFLNQPAHAFFSGWSNPFSYVRDYFYGPQTNDVAPGSSDFVGGVCKVEDPSPIQEDSVLGPLAKHFLDTYRSVVSDQELKECVDNSKIATGRPEFGNPRKFDYMKTCACYRSSDSSYLLRDERLNKVQKLIDDFKKKTYKDQLNVKTLMARSSLSEVLVYAKNTNIKLPNSCEGIEKKISEVACSPAAKERMKEEFSRFLKEESKRAESYLTTPEVLRRDDFLLRDNDAKRRFQRGRQDMIGAVGRYIGSQDNLASLSDDKIEGSAIRFADEISSPINVRIFEDRTKESDRTALRMIGDNFMSSIKSLNQEQLRELGIFASVEEGDQKVASIMRAYKNFGSDQQRLEFRRKLYGTVARTFLRENRNSMARLGRRANTNGDAGAVKPVRDSVDFFYSYFRSPEAIDVAFEHLEKSEEPDKFDGEIFSEKFGAQFEQNVGKSWEDVVGKEGSDHLATFCESTLDQQKQICTGVISDDYKNVSFSMPELSEFLDKNYQGDDLGYTASMCEVVDTKVYSIFTARSSNGGIKTDLFTNPEDFQKALTATNFSIDDKMFSEESIFARVSVGPHRVDPRAGLVSEGNGDRLVSALDSASASDDPMARSLMGAATTSALNTIGIGIINTKGTTEGIPREVFETNFADTTSNESVNRHMERYGIKASDVDDTLDKYFAVSPKKSSAQVRSNIDTSTTVASPSREPASTSDSSERNWGDVFSDATQSITPNHNTNSSIFDKPSVSVTSDSTKEEVKVLPEATDSAISAELKKLRDDNEKMRAELEAQRKAMADNANKASGEGNSALEARIKALQLELDASEKRITAAEKELKEREAKVAREKAEVVAKAQEVEKRVFPTPAHTTAPVKSKPEEYATPSTAMGGNSGITASAPATRISGGSLTGGGTRSNSAMGANYSNASGFVLTSKEFESLSLNDLSQREGQVLRVQEITRRSDGVAQLVTKQYKVVKMDGVHITMPVDENGEVIMDASEGRAPASVVVEVLDDKVYTEADLRRLEREQEERARHKRLIEELEAARK